jgi:23S rRNA (cytosine1962-C5)-methyltransferase
VFAAFGQDAPMALHGVPVSSTVAAHLTAGAPSVALQDLQGSGDVKGLEPGRPIRFLDPKGEVVASGIADPENEVIHVLARRAVRGFDAGFFERRLAASVVLRRALGLVDGKSAYRLVNGEGDGLPGFWIDVYGAFAVLSTASRALLPFARIVAAATLAISGEPALGLRGVVIKVRSKDPQDRSHKDEVLGETPPEKYVVHELDVPYEVHLLGALNVGLFCDMREQRRGLGRFVQGRRVLNTFAYTGALSVTAARLGASAVTSVDLSSGVLAWARENFRLSGLDPADPRYRFEVSDVRRFLERERERGTTYDSIILDPPTVSAARASQWSMKKDYPELISLATKLLPEEGGFLWVSGNTRRGPSVVRHVQEGIKLAGRSAVVLELGGLPPDFPTPVDWPDSRYLEICHARVSGAGA